MSYIYFYLNDDGSICRDQTKRPKVLPAQVGVARLVKKKSSDVLEAISRLGLKVALKDGELARHGLYLIEYADDTFDLTLYKEAQDER